MSDSSSFNEPNTETTVIFYPSIMTRDKLETDELPALNDLSHYVFNPIKNQGFKWPYPWVTVYSSELNKKPKMDIAVATAVDTTAESASETVDDQHLLSGPDDFDSTLKDSTLEDLPDANAVSSSINFNSNNTQNDPQSFKTIVTPESSLSASSKTSNQVSNLEPGNEAINSSLTNSQPANKTSDQSASQTPDVASNFNKPLDGGKNSKSGNNKLEASSPEYDNDNINSSKLNKVNATEPNNVNDKFDDDQIDQENLDPEELSRLEEEQRKDKEAKLEAYKQFVAEQESQIEIDYQGIRVSIEANALPSRTYFTMNALSAIIASYGLVVNSAAVVIGAMLVAMMLGPISGVALATIDYRIPLLRKSLLTVIAGGTMVVIIGMIVGWIHKDVGLSNEILSRTQPSSMDLMIALAGGTAGAYAMISPKLSVAVVGVAVATALVPPLAASGILFAHSEGGLGFGALLLAITNIIAIQFTNALVLWFAGFRRLKVEDYKKHPFIAFCQRNAVPLVLLVGIGGYLSYNFNVTVKKQNFENDVSETINDYFIEKGNALATTQFVANKDYQMIRAVIRGETRPTSIDAKHLENLIAKNRSENYPNYLPVRVQLRYMPIVVIDSSPDFNGQINKTDAAILGANDH